MLGEVDVLTYPEWRLSRQIWIGVGVAALVGGGIALLLRMDS